MSGPTVHVTRFKGRAFQLQWRDPETGKVKTKSSKTRNREEACAKARGLQWSMREVSVTERVRGVLSELTVPNMGEVRVSVLPANSHHLYFLFDKGQISYVGQSVSYWSRVPDHIRKGKIFDTVCVVEVPSEWVSQAEAWCILMLKPRDNGQWKNASGRALLEKQKGVL